MVPTIFTNFSNHSLSSIHHDKTSGRSHSDVPSLKFRSRTRPFSTFSFRNSAVSAMAPLPGSPSKAKDSPSKATNTGTVSPRRSRWNRRSRQVQVQVQPVPLPVPKPRVTSIGKNSLTKKDIEVGVCMIDGDDGWALLVHPSPKKQAAAKAAADLGVGSKLAPPLTPRERTPSFNKQTLKALEGQRDPTPVGLSSSANLPGHNLHTLGQMDESDAVDALPSGLNSAPATIKSFGDVSRQGIPARRQSLPPAPPSAFLRPPPGRPVSVIAAPVTQAPIVSCLHRQSLPPAFDGPRPSIKFADDPPQPDLATRAATVASLNETLRLRREYASLQSRHAKLYDAALEARNEISRLRTKLSHSHDVMEHLIDWGLAMQTENEILREQIPDSAAFGPVTVKTAEELRALFDVNFGE